MYLYGFFHDVEVSLGETQMRNKYSFCSPTVHGTLAVQAEMLRGVSQVKSQWWES